MKTYNTGQMLEVIVARRCYRVTGFEKKRVVTTKGAFRYSQIEGWRLPWGHTFQPNLHMILPLCNKGSQKLW